MCVGREHKTHKKRQVPRQPGTGVVTSGGFQRRLVGKIGVAGGAVAKDGDSGRIARPLVGVHSAGSTMMLSGCFFTISAKVWVLSSDLGFRASESRVRALTKAVKIEMTETRLDCG